nr:cation transporter [Nocardioidaceae bacterium]
TLATDNGRWDAAGTAMIGILLVLIAIILAIEMKSLLLGEAASDSAIRRIREALVGDGTEGVTEVIHMRTMHLGPEELLVTAKIAVPGAASADDTASAINAAEARVREVEPLAQMIYLEPDRPR